MPVSIRDNLEGCQSSRVATRRSGGLRASRNSRSSGAERPSLTEAEREASRYTHVHHGD
ncbi:hypothetical protein C5N14_13195 [Micromonospora sp. MW-13]|nr:hypothetical protein [Micromonospora sp. MW-13]RGC68469.1 hypothetical protein C5N14_13195 [Micromonospora sp. MW-13]